MKIQNKFFNCVKEKNIPVTIFLLNGVKIIGTIVDFSEDVLFVKKEMYVQLVYKNAISTISPRDHNVVLEAIQENV